MSGRSDSGSMGLDLSKPIQDFRVAVANCDRTVEQEPNQRTDVIRRECAIVGRKWNWPRAVPSGLTEAPKIAQGFPKAGGFGGRESHSRAFFNTPETEKLYSGVASISASAAATSPRNRSTEEGKPRCSTSAL